MKMGKSANVIALYILIMTAIGPVLSANFNITSPPMGYWGNANWGEMEYCPPGKFVHGLQLKIQPEMGFFWDNTAINGIRLFCGDPDDSGTKVVTSTVGKSGFWGRIHKFDYYVMYGFKLLVDPYPKDPNTTKLDYTGANNIASYVTFEENYWYVDSYGNKRGQWFPPQLCDVGKQGICGIQTQVSPFRGIMHDDDGLQSVTFECCDFGEMGPPTRPPKLVHI